MQTHAEKIPRVFACRHFGRQRHFTREQTPMKVRIKNDLYFCMEDDGMTRDGETYTAADIMRLSLEEHVIRNGRRRWKLQIPKGTVCDVAGVPQDWYVPVQFNDEVEYIDKEQCEWNV